MAKKDTLNDYTIRFEGILDVRVEIPIPLGGTEQQIWVSMSLTWSMEETWALGPKGTFYTPNPHVNGLNQHM